MLLDLKSQDIVDHFKSVIMNLPFVPSTDYGDINKQLAILADLPNNKGRSKKHSRTAKVDAF